MYQMAPLAWINLYFYFLLLFLLSIIMNYYSLLYTPKSLKMKKLDNKINWKW